MSGNDAQLFYLFFFFFKEIRQNLFVKNPWDIKVPEVEGIPN